MVIEEYNTDWLKQFLQIKEAINKNLSKIIAIEHVGSTSIDGMCAKPVIDIIIIIDRKDDFKIAKRELESIGYYHNGNQGAPGREVFKRNKLLFDEILDTISHHLYVCSKDNDELKKEVLFRDYLKKHEDSKKAYYNIKKEIIQKTGNENREAYVAMKADDYNWFFKEVHEKAEKEYAENGSPELW